MRGADPIARDYRNIARGRPWRLQVRYSSKWRLVRFVLVLGDRLNTGLMMGLDDRDRSESAVSV
jgi:hypothetical protein